MSKKVKNAIENDINKIQTLIYNRLDFLYNNEPEDSVEYRKLLNCLHEIRRSESTVATVQTEGWIKVTNEPTDYTKKLKVSNGWVYKDNNIGMCFVPEEDTSWLGDFGLGR